MISSGFPSTFFKCFSTTDVLLLNRQLFAFTLDMLFLLRSSFTVCHANSDRIIWAFLSFYALMLVEFLFFISSRFSLPVIDSEGTLLLALGLIGQHTAAASMWVETKIFDIWSMSFWGLLRSITFFFLFPYINYYITISKWELVISWRFTFSFRISA